MFLSTKSYFLFLCFSYNKFWWRNFTDHKPLLEMFLSSVSDGWSHCKIKPLIWKYLNLPYKTLPPLSPEFLEVPGSPFRPPSQRTHCIEITGSTFHVTCSLYWHCSKTALITFYWFSRLLNQVQYSFSCLVYPFRSRAKCNSPLYWLFTVLKLLGKIREPLFITVSMQQGHFQFYSSKKG